MSKRSKLISKVIGVLLAFTLLLFSRCAINKKVNYKSGLTSISLIEFNPQFHLLMKITYHKDKWHSGKGHVERLQVDILEPLNIKIGEKYNVNIDTVMLKLNYSYITSYNWRMGDLPIPKYSGYVIFNNVSDSIINVKMNIKVTNGAKGYKSRHFKGVETFTKQESL